MNDRLPWALVALGLIAAISIWLMPIRSDLAFWRPPFVLLLVIYWLFQRPQYFGGAFVWMVGLGIDILFGQILGQHALAMLVAGYLVISQQHRMHHFRILYQSLFVAGVVLAYEVVLLSVRLMVEDIEIIRPLFYPVLSSVLLWPLLFGTLQKFRRSQW